MKKFVCLFCFLFFVINYAYAEVVTVPAGTVVPFEYDVTVSSKKTQQDEQIPITIVRDVIVNNKIIFQRGAKGYLTVFDVYKVQTWNISEYKKGGYIEIEDGMVQDINGTMHNITFKDSKKGSDLGPSYSSASYGYANVNPKYNLGGANINATGYSTLHENRLTGENVTIPKGTRARAVTSETFNIDVK